MNLLSLSLVMTFALGGWAAKVEAGLGNASTLSADGDNLAVAASDIGGVVSGPNGPEAGVWVIAETVDRPRNYRKIVVTDDKGRFLAPDMPKENYKVWVRGYGLVDSAPIDAVPGAKLVLTAVPAPDARAAAQIYPPNYWLSLMQIPPTSEFPMMRSGGPHAGEMHSQAEWISAMRKCQSCHQLGDKATREIEPSLGTFDSPQAAWDRRTKSGQRGPFMYLALNQFPRDRVLAMLSDWTTRIAAGEVPPSPPRPQGIERNVVVTEWDWGSGAADWIHDEIATDKRNPMVNPHGKIYGAANGSGSMVIADPNTNEVSEIKVPTRADPKTIQYYKSVPLVVHFASPYFGDQLIWTDPTSPHNPMMDQEGRIWLTSVIRPKDNPAYCKEGSNNPYAMNFPIKDSQRQLSLYDPKTEKWTFIDTCFGTHHLQFANDKDNTLYFSGQDGVVGWVNTRVLEKTGDEQTAQGWCPAYYDTKGDGKYDPQVDKIVGGFPYGLVVNPVDGTAWYAVETDVMPGKIVRIDRGSNPPGTCRTEVYEPPYQNPKAPDKQAFSTRGIDVDSNGVIWAALNSGQLASFDRRKCAVRSGPTATGQQCPEGWTLYQVPGPMMKGAADSGTGDYSYYDWVDQFGTLGLGKNVPIETGTNSDSLLVLQPDTGKWIVLRVPYPMGFFARGLDGRIDDPKAGWKGRALWSTYAANVVWHMEGGKKALSPLVRFQIRPNPLAH
ncbi:MAG: hypothetical protein WCC21_00925 [Candidatus Acidiferrales bacterium]